MDLGEEVSDGRADLTEAARDYTLEDAAGAFEAVDASVLVRKGRAKPCLEIGS